MYFMARSLYTYRTAARTRPQCAICMPNIRIQFRKNAEIRQKWTNSAVRLKIPCPGNWLMRVWNLYASDTVNGYVSVDRCQSVRSAEVVHSRVWWQTVLFCWLEALYGPALCWRTTTGYVLFLICSDKLSICWYQYVSSREMGGITEQATS